MKYILIARQCFSSFSPMGRKARNEAVEKLKTVSDQELKESLGKVVKIKGEFDLPLYEPCLCEMVRRGGTTWEAFLKAKWEARAENLGTDDTGMKRLRCSNLELLTALRRVQKKPDPLAVSVDERDPIEVTMLSLPKLRVSVKNMDREGASFFFKREGDFRPNGWHGAASYRAR